MLSLTPDQARAVECSDDVVVTACPGSGKTRVLTAKVMEGLAGLQSNRERVVALTFTNRAADEIKTRIDNENISTNSLWAGTIHSFAIEWILRPYSPYLLDTRSGFTVADEYQTEQILNELKDAHGLQSYTTINTSRLRNGDIINESIQTDQVCTAYKNRLRSEKLIDYDDILYLAYNLVHSNTEIAATLSNIFKLICVDEVQDIQDLQFGILSEIVRCADIAPKIFLVGDNDQSIYESLGATSLSPDQIRREFDLDVLQHFELSENYRSTQRIIDVCRVVRPSAPVVTAAAEYAHENGVVWFNNQGISSTQLAGIIAQIITNALNAGVPPKEICVIAPRWVHVRSMARQLVALLPEIPFDAPGLSPLHSSRDNIWFKLARLFLSGPSPNRYRTRIRWANELLADLHHVAATELSDSINTARRLLRSINSITSAENEGVDYLRDVFSQFMQLADIALNTTETLETSHEVFFTRVETRIANREDGIPSDIASFRRIFNYPTGIVVNTCHGIKGEEYDTVIAFGLLKGFVPHWDIIINGSNQDADESESKLLYVILSRAKKHLYLISENGRFTQSRRPYETSQLLLPVAALSD